MECQNVIVCGKTVSIPAYYQQVDYTMPDIPDGAASYMVQTENALCFAMLFPVDESKSLPRSRDSLIAGIRQFLGENRGLDSP